MLLSRESGTQLSSGNLPSSGHKKIKNATYRNDSSWKTRSTARRIGCVFLFWLIKLCAFEIGTQH